MSETVLPPDIADLKCLLADDDVGIHLQFGYRGCFGGSDNDFDLEVGSRVSVSGHLWTGLSTNRTTEAVPLTRDEGRADMRLLVDALGRPDEASAVWTTTKAFVRVSYWCGTRREGPFILETHSPSADDEKEVERIFVNLKKRRPPREAHHRSYSRVHETIAAARSILASVAGQDRDASAQAQAACRRAGSLYEGGLRVRHDPAEERQDH